MPRESTSRRDYPAGLFDPKACRRCKAKGHVHHGDGACGFKSCECTCVDLTELCLGCEAGDHGTHVSGRCDVICTSPGAIGPIACECAWPARPLGDAELVALRNLYEASSKFSRALMAYLDRHNTKRLTAWADGLGAWMNAIAAVRSARREG